MSDREKLARWRLVLGGLDNETFDNALSEKEKAQDTLLEYLYGREYDASKRNIRQKKRTGGLNDTELNVPTWINGVHELFPQRAIERLEKDALERYKIEELVTRPDLLKRAEPSMTLLKAILHTKHLMNHEVLALAKDLVRKVIAEILERLATPVRHPFLGRRHPYSHSPMKISKNFDAKRTIRENLKFYDPLKKRIVIRKPLFFSRVRNHMERWQLIILVDQSGSMVESVIYSAVCASIFWGISALKTHLVAFDTNIVDLTGAIDDPVTTLMKVQLGGGTDIGQAMGYALQLMEHPKRTIVVLISDFYEGSNPNVLLKVIGDMIESGAKVLGLAALDERSNPDYNKQLAQVMVNLGAHIGCMTPGELADWVAECIG